MKKKRKRKDEKNSTLSPVANTVTNLTPNALILSGGKLMPLVAPMTSNIIVNTQQASTNPIILGNTQQNQMIVMQPLANRVQNSVVSICNHALINTVQKVTLNTVPSIQTNMVVDSHNWASNVKNIINATKIGGHKGILPKGKEITKTTMAYKVPIPAIHKDKVEKPKDGAGKKESEVKAKGNKNHPKSHKSIQSTPETAEELNVEKKSPKDSIKTQEDPSAPRKGAFKRGLSVESDSADEPEDKKRKDANGEAKSAQPIAAKATDFTATCKSIVSLKHVIEKIGENIRDEHATVSNEKESVVTKSNNITQVTQATNDTDREETSMTSKLMDITDTNCFDVNKKTTEDAVTSQAVASDKFSGESHETNAPEQSSNEFNISIDSITEKSSTNMEHLDAKSTLTDVEVAEKAAGSDGPKKTCNLGTRFDSLLRVATAKEQQRVNDAESNKIILNLDTNTTTTMKSDANIVDVATSVSVSSSSSSTSSSSSPLITNVVNDEAKLTKTSKDEISKLPYSNENTFVPISNRTDGLHSDLSNDIFASLNVPSSSHNPESISPTAAFLMAFPLVSSLNGKTEVLDEEMKDDFKYHSQTPPMLLQIGTMEPNSFKIKTSSTSHAIAEKRLKTSYEEKQSASTNVNTNTDVIVPVECATTKSLPKVVNEETLREPYKIVQTVLTPSLEKSVTTSVFTSQTSVNFSAVDSSCIIGNSSSLATNQSRSGQLRTTNTLNSVNVIASQASVNISVSTDKNDIADCTSSQVATSRNPDMVYSGSQEFLPSYSSIVGNSLVSLQHTHTSNSSMFKNTIATTQESNSTVGPRTVNNINGSQNLLSTRLENATVTTNSSSGTLRPLQTDYSTQTKNKSSQSSSHAIYPSHKDTLLDSTGIVSDHHVDYANQMERGLPVTSQSMQSYSVSTKESSLPILPSQDMQHMYSQNKENHVLLDLNGSQQTFAVQKKQEHIIASSYIGNQAKAMSQKDSISFTSDNETASTTSRNQEYVTKTANQSSSENTFQRNYSKLNKSTDTLNSPNQINQETKLNNVLVSKTQEQQHNHIRDSAYVAAKKLDVDPFVQSYQYDVKEAMSNPSERTNVLNANTDANTHNSYVTYPSKGDKKNAAISTVAMTNNKSAAVQQSADVARYSQQTSSFIVTSNYEQSTMTENHAKSTTTVAHNSSNFSILSWTTFSPVSSGSGGNGNNNLVHYDQGQPHPNDNTEAKTICENYNYIPLHKDNSSFPNQVLIGDNYSSSSTMSTGIDKSRQGKIESQKQSFVDSSKTRNDPSKQNRMQSQQTGNDYKFPDGGKSKNKYGMDSDYMQNEYSTTMDPQQHSQQHGQKNHQNLSSKQEKTVYTYEPQINFDLAESNVQMKYSIEAYTGVNFKYAEKTSQQPSQHKYQVLPQSQISLHDSGSYSSDVKQQQQQQPQQSHSSNNNSNNNKAKSNQHQQHAIKAPVNWMMTPEIKHAELALPMVKELEFCQNNLFTQTPAYNQSTPNQFYNNYDVSAAHSFPNLPVLQSDPKRPAETFYSEEQPFPWSPTKNNVHNSVEHAIGQSSVKCIEQHIVPSSLQSLVSDLDLSTNLEKQNFLFGAPTSRISTEQNKDGSIKEKETNNVSGRDLHAILNTQNTQHPASTFLSVSQLVEHEKEKSHQQQTHQQHQHHQHHHPHQHQHSQQQQHQQQQQQARKHQRKSNASPRTNSKRQIDIRKSTTTNDNNLHQRHEEQKSSGHVFTEQGYQQPQQQQQQKYQQNNIHWRSRNCKSNYTAEALIGTSIHDTGSHQDKHASIKFTNYPQNKFQSGLSADAAVMPINYFSSAPPPDDGTVTGYGQSVVNQNFNTYAYPSNSANSIYPTSNFITSISNTPNSYMAMPLHENAADYVQETNSFLLPNVAGTSSSSSASTANTSTANTSSTTAGNANGNGKNHQHYGKHSNCDKRSYSTVTKKGKRKTLESGPMQNLEFSLSGINSPLEDYHHSTSFLAPPPPPPPAPPPPPPPPHANPLYQNHPQTNVYAKTVNSLPPPPPSAMASAQGVATVGAAGFSMNSNMVRGGIVSSNPMAMPHHPSGTSLTNFNLSTIFPEMNDKVSDYAQ